MMNCRFAKPKTIFIYLWQTSCLSWIKLFYLQPQSSLKTQHSPFSVLFGCCCTLTLHLFWLWARVCMCVFVYVSRKSWPNNLGLVACCAACHSCFHWHSDWAAVPLHVFQLDITSNQPAWNLKDPLSSFIQPGTREVQPCGVRDFSLQNVDSMFGNSSWNLYKKSWNIF